MTRTATAQVIDALEAQGVQVNAALHATITGVCGASVRQLSGTELAGFIRQFKPQIAGNSAPTGKLGPLELVVGGLSAGPAPAFGVNRSAGATFAVNADQSQEAQQLIRDLAGAGFTTNGVTAGDLESLGLERLRELHRNHTFQGYCINEAAGTDDAGELIRLAAAVQTTVRGASVATLVHLGAERLKQLAADLAAATSATSPANHQPTGAVGGHAGYSLNEFLGG